MKVKSTSAHATTVTLNAGETVNPAKLTPHEQAKADNAALTSALELVTAHFRLASPSQASKALHAARAVSIAAAEQGSENSRLPIIAETAKHGTSSKTREGREVGTVTRSVASLDADKLKARRSRERILNAAVLLGMASGKAL